MWIHLLPSTQNFSAKNFKNICVVVIEAAGVSPKNSTSNIINRSSDHPQLPITIYHPDLKGFRCIIYLEFSSKERLMGAKAKHDIAPVIRGAFLNALALIEKDTGKTFPEMMRDCIEDHGLLAVMDKVSK